METHVAAVAPGEPVQGGAHLPLVIWQGAWPELVSTVVETPMVAGAAPTPAIVDNHSVLREEKQNLWFLGCPAGSHSP